MRQRPPAGVAPAGAAPFHGNANELADANFERLHPRGRDGRFIKKFGRVVIEDPFGGKYTATVDEVGVDGRGGITVVRDDGTRAKVKKNWVVRTIPQKARLDVDANEHDLPENHDDLLREVADQMPEHARQDSGDPQMSRNVRKRLERALAATDPVQRMAAINSAILGLKRTGDYEVAKRLEALLERELMAYNDSLLD